MIFLTLKSWGYELIKHLQKYQQNGDFIKILSQKTAINDGEMVAISKYLKIAFQNCLKNYPSPRIMREMNCLKIAAKLTKRRFHSNVTSKTAIIMAYIMDES